MTKQALARFFTSLEEAPGQSLTVALGDALLHCQLSSSRPALAESFHRMGSTIASPPTGHPSACSRPPTLRIVQDNTVLAELHRLAAPLMSEAGPLIPPMPRIATFRSDESPRGDGVLLQVPNPSGRRDPFLYFAHWPRIRAGTVVLVQENRRAENEVRVIALDTLMAYSNFYGMHASAVNHNGRGILFAGHAGAGKTSLTLAFLCMGAKFLAEDLSVISPAGWVLPHEHKEMTLRSSTVSYLVSKGRHGTLRSVESSNGEQYAFASELFGTGVYGHATPLTTIVLPEYQQGSSVRISDVPPQQALDVLQNHLLPWMMRWEQAYDLPQKKHAVVTHLTKLIDAGTVQITRMTYGSDLDAAVAELAWYLDRREETPL